MILNEPRRFWRGTFVKINSKANMASAAELQLSNTVMCKSDIKSLTILMSLPLRQSCLKGDHTNRRKTWTEYLLRRTKWVQTSRQTFDFRFEAPSKSKQTRGDTVYIHHRGTFFFFSKFCIMFMGCVRIPSLLQALYILCCCLKPQCQNPVY